MKRELEVASDNNNAVRVAVPSFPCPGNGNAMIPLHHHTKTFSSSTTVKPFPSYNWLIYLL